MGRHGLEREIAAFKAAKEIEVARARQLAALQLACHIDLDAAMASSVEGRRQLAVRLERMIERERLRGVRRHWSYDLNRHIALKQALDGLTGNQKIERQPAKPRTRRFRRPLNSRQSK